MAWNLDDVERKRRCWEVKLLRVTFGLMQAMRERVHVNNGRTNIRNDRLEQQPVYVQVGDGHVGRALAPRSAGFPGRSSAD